MNRRMIYIAGPISRGDLAHNINQATEAFRALALAGLAPLCPHWSAYSSGARVAEGTREVYAVATAAGCGLSHADWLAVDLAFVERSDAVLRLPGESTGADLETAHAIAHGIPVFDDIDAALQWSRRLDARGCHICGQPKTLTGRCATCRSEMMAREFCGEA